MSNIKKLYIAYKAGYLGKNVMDSYFSFVANLILDKKLYVIEDIIIAKEFEKRYSIELPLPFARQILGVGVKNGCFIEDHGRYSVVIEKLSNYRFSDVGFNRLWNALLDEYGAYCQSIGIDTNKIDLGEFVLDILDNSDEMIISGEKAECVSDDLPLEYAWYSFVKLQGEDNSDIYMFISALSASNITRQALFFVSERDADYSQLHVYLDSPIVFALLGMDVIPRTESYKKLVEDMLKAKCKVHVLDHNYQEVEGIIARASTWATSTQYDLRKANNASRFFHDSQMDDAEIAEFCENIEHMLNDLGITIKETGYDIYQDKFQEDEESLFNMIQSRYQDRGYELSYEKEESIHVDVRSIIMIYRERKGNVATKIQQSQHIMLTSNNAIANVSKQYESNRSINAGHIPACVSADLFGAVLWLDSPMRLQDYQKKKLLADCYAFLKPDKALLDKYIQSVEKARDLNEIDEKEFLFLRTHRVVLDALMDITKGDYARFDSNTYREVYNNIKEKAEKHYQDEVNAHLETREKLENIEKTLAEEQERNRQENNELRRQIQILKEEKEQREADSFEKKVRFWGWACTVFLCGIPYVTIVVGIELAKTHFSKVSLYSMYGLLCAVLATIIAGVIYKRGKECCFVKVRHILERKDKRCC